MQDRIIAEARTWLGTPFQHQGRVKGQGVDCLGLLVGVARHLRLKDGKGTPLEHHDALAYGHYPDAKALQRALSQLLHDRRVMPPEQGNIVLLRIDSHARHMAIVGVAEHYKTLIHAYAPARKVVEHRLDERWEKQIVRCYRLTQ